MGCPDQESSRAERWVQANGLVDLHTVHREPRLGVEIREEYLRWQVLSLRRRQQPLERVRMVSIRTSRVREDSWERVLFIFHRSQVPRLRRVTERSKAVSDAFDVSRLQVTTRQREPPAWKLHPQPLRRRNTSVA